MIENTLVRAALLSLVLVPACAKQDAATEAEETSESQVDGGDITGPTEPDGGQSAASAKVDSGVSDPVEAGPIDSGEATLSDAGSPAEVMTRLDASASDPRADAGPNAAQFDASTASNDGADASTSANASAANASAADASDGAVSSVLGPDGVPLICPMGDPTGEATECADEFSITVTCVSGPCAMTTYVHNFEVTWHGLEFTGTGTVIGDNASPTEAVICGGIADETLSFEFVYTTYVPGYTVDGVAAVAEDGTALGTGNGFDPRGATQEFNVDVSTMNVGCRESL